MTIVEFYKGISGKQTIVDALGGISGKETISERLMANMLAESNDDSEDDPEAAEDDLT